MICGFNMDLPDGMLDWKLIMDTYVYAILEKDHRRKTSYD